MAGKLVAMTQSKALRYALDHLTKNSAIDMLLDCCYRDIGEGASDDEIAAWFTQTLGPVARIRGDRPIDFANPLEAFRRRIDAHQAKQLGSV